MGIEALTVDAEGLSVIPATDDEWREWVSASSTRNYAIRDPLLDWLELYGEQNGFRPDDEIPGYDPRTDFTQFIFRQGHAFEQAVVDYLGTLTAVEQVGGGDAADSRDLGKAEETFAAMQRGAPIIYQGVVRDAATRTYGSPDMLVRSDVLADLFPDTVEESEAGAAAPDLGSAPWHYVVVDIKFTTLRLLVSGGIQSGGSTRAYKAQLYIYSRALGRLQGYTPPASYILGRSWRGPVDGKTVRGSTCMERLGRVPQDSTVARGATLEGMTDEAVEWGAQGPRGGDALVGHAGAVSAPAQAEYAQYERLPVELGKEGDRGYLGGQPLDRRHGQHPGAGPAGTDGVLARG